MANTATNMSVKTNINERDEVRGFSRSATVKPDQKRNEQAQRQWNDDDIKPILQVLKPGRGQRQRQHRFSGRGRVANQ